MPKSDVLGAVVIALVKLENLKAIHNGEPFFYGRYFVVIALVKLENLKAIHNSWKADKLLYQLLLH